MGIFATGGIHAGDLVEIRSREEILATLDETGCIDGMPFMPEMLRYCGRQARVVKVAHKTCDTIHYSGIRSIKDAVHLEGLLCDGAAHGGCQAGCLLFWKTAWLKRVRPDHSEATGKPSAAAPVYTEELLNLHVRRQDGDPDDIRYVCQITKLLKASRPLAWWNPIQYIRDVTSRNFSAAHVISVLALAVLRWTIPRVRGMRLQLAAYNWIARKTGRPAYDSVVNFRGTIPVDSPTPADHTTFEPGEWVRVRSLPEISATLNRRGQNRGMFFDSEMVPFCDRPFRVKGLVTRLINEDTGRMMVMKNPCIVLEGVVCRSEYSTKRLMCPRSIQTFWRPNWLEKHPEGAHSDGA